MKVKPLNIKFESIDDFMERTKSAIERAIKEKKPSIQRKDVMVWASVEAYQRFMSDQKYTILATIFKYQPQSVYQLAKILNRAQQNVAKECALLAGHGFIKFENSKDGRNTKPPRLAFDYNAIFVHLPIVTYKVEFVETEAA